MLFGYSATCSQKYPYNIHFKGDNHCFLKSSHPPVQLWVIGKHHILRRMLSFERKSRRDEQDSGIRKVVTMVTIEGMQTGSWEQCQKSFTGLQCEMVESCSEEQRSSHMSSSPVSLSLSLWIGRYVWNEDRKREVLKGQRRVAMTFLQ